MAERGKYLYNKIVIITSVNGKLLPKTVRCFLVQLGLFWSSTRLPNPESTYVHHIRFHTHTHVPKGGANQATASHRLRWECASSLWRKKGPTKPNPPIETICTEEYRFAFIRERTTRHTKGSGGDLQLRQSALKLKRECRIEPTTGCWFARKDVQSDENIGTAVNRSIFIGRTRPDSSLAMTSASSAFKDRFLTANQSNWTGNKSQIPPRRYGPISRTQYNFPIFHHQWHFIFFLTVGAAGRRLNPSAIHRHNRSL